MSRPLEVIALDVEGTLISNAVSQIARPDLRVFLEFCAKAVPRVVIYTSVREEKFRQIAGTLVGEGLAPEWFLTVEYVDWSGKHKDLRKIPHVDVSRTVLVDDFEGYVYPGQEEQWISIRSYAAPYGADDDEFTRVQRVIEERWGCAV